MTFTIMNKRTKKFVYGTDFRCYPHRQFTSVNEALTFSRRESAELAMKMRGCGKDYIVIPVKLVAESDEK